MAVYACPSVCSCVRVFVCVCGYKNKTYTNRKIYAQCIAYSCCCCCCCYCFLFGTTTMAITKKLSTHFQLYIKHSKGNKEEKRDPFMEFFLSLFYFLVSGHFFNWTFQTWARSLTLNLSRFS